MNNEYLLVAIWSTAIFVSFNSDHPVLGVVAFMMMIVHMSIHHYSKHRVIVSWFGLVALIFPIISSFPESTEIIDIASQEDLFLLCEDPDQAYQLVDDIYISDGFTIYANGTCDGFRFSGSLNGNNHSIYNLTFPLFGGHSQWIWEQRGLFMATIENLQIVNPMTDAIFASKVVASTLRNIQLRDINLDYLKQTDCCGNFAGAGLLVQSSINGSILENITIDGVTGNLDRLDLFATDIVNSSFSSINFINIESTISELVIFGSTSVSNSDFYNVNVFIEGDIATVSLLSKSDDLTSSLNDIHISHLTIQLPTVDFSELVIGPVENSSIDNLTWNGEKYEVELD